MTTKLSDDLAMCAVAAARYEQEGTDEALCCLRLEVESVWERCRRVTQEAHERLRLEAAEEFAEMAAADIREPEPTRLKVIT